MISDKDLKRVITDNDYLYGKDGSWRSYYQDLANFCLPRKAWITTMRVTGDRIKDEFLFDQRAIRCAKESVCGIHSNLTNPSSRWFATVTNDRDMQSGAVQKYFKERDEIQFDIMNDSNFNNTSLENYMDHMVFGMGNMLTQEDEQDHVRYTEVPIEQYQIAEDDRGRVVRVYRNFKWTSLQCYDRWGDDCPSEVIKAVNEKPFQLWDILHYVSPRDRYDSYKRDYYNMPYQSLWIMKKPLCKLEEKGFETNPFAVSRFWKDSNDPRGFSPAMDALASIKLINAEKRTFIRHAMKASDPAWMAPYKGFLNSPNFNPNAGNYYDPKHHKADSFRFLTPEGNSGLNIQAMEMEAFEIERAFFVDVFRAISNITQDKKKRSIPEIQRLVSEGLSMLGPIIGKILDESLTPTLERTGLIISRRGMFPPVPKALIDQETGEGKEINMTYLSPLARAQRQSQLTGITAWMGMIGEIAQLKPEVLDAINVDKVSKTIAEIQGVDPEFYYDDEVVKEMRKQRLQQARAAQQAAMAEDGANAVHKGAQAVKALSEANN